MTEKEKMLSGEFYDVRDNELSEARRRARAITNDYNNTSPYEKDKRKSILRELFGNTREGFKIEPPFHCDYGTNIEWGEDVHVNFNCTILDCAKVKIGRKVLIAPNVGIYTAAHPIDPKLREKGLEYAKPIIIEENVWIGAGAIINPGIIIGKNSVIGSGSVVTKDIPANVVAVGNPCKVIKYIYEVE